MWLDRNIAFIESWRYWPGEKKIRGGYKKCPQIFDELPGGGREAQPLGSPARSLSQGLGKEAERMCAGKNAAQKTAENKAQQIFCLLGLRRQRATGLVRRWGSAASGGGRAAVLSPGFGQRRAGWGLGPQLWASRSSQGPACPPVTRSAASPLPRVPSADGAGPSGDGPLVPRPLSPPGAPTDGPGGGGRALRSRPRPLPAGLQPLRAAVAGRGEPVAHIGAPLGALSPQQEAASPVCTAPRGQPPSGTDVRGVLHLGPF